MVWYQSLLLCVLFPLRLKCLIKHQDFKTVCRQFLYICYCVYLYACVVDLPQEFRFPWGPVWGVQRDRGHDPGSIRVTWVDPTFWWGFSLVEYWTYTVWLARCVSLLNDVKQKVLKARSLLSLSQLYWAVVLLQHESHSEITYTQPNPNPNFLSWTKGLIQVRTNAHDKCAL